MPLRRESSHSGPVDEPSTSREVPANSNSRGDENYLQYIMRLLRARRTCRDFIEQREKMGPGLGNNRSRTFEMNSLLAELEHGISEELMKAEITGLSSRAVTPCSNYHDHVVASPTRLSPIEVKVEDSQEPTDAPHSLLTMGNAESNVEKAAKQEAQVMMRIAELRRSGLWTASRLPLCVAPPRNKTHWDYVLEEMKWMATDFRMERQFKRNVARKIAAAIQKQKRDDEIDQERAHLRSIRDGKRICASIAKMVRDFWQSVDKVVEHRAQEILESKKRKALDAHMAFIVGEADKLSSMVQEGLAQDRGASKTPSNTSRDDDNVDADFCVSESESDDEITIEREEAAMQQHEIDDIQEEVSALSKDADQDMDDFLASLPPEYLASIGVHLPSISATGRSDIPIDSEGDDEHKTVKDSANIQNEKVERIGSSPEETRAKRPKLEEASSSDSGARRKSSRARTSTAAEEASKAEEDEVSIDEEDCTVTRDQNALLEGNGDGCGMLESVDYSKLNSINSNERQQELANIAEAALKFQPKGFTLETTQIKTAVPFLVRGTLREYQMVGLDWLVTLYEKNLNGILADEMGLGKTIQTIALLAHLACCESVWGPHLIVVPTSVILNWEMELKKWCPAFKILTYFGSQKDRAEKRRGWSKPNAFHVCVTSYKTVTADIRAFKMKAWQYLILDEAQNIKNWKSQRWQTLLNVKARRRLLLTGTPLQNSLMELWSLMHFLMPAIFASHDDFKDWFSNPLTGMMDGSVEYSAPLVLRPFILRRLKSEVEKQLPKKTEHVIKCPLSKRQRYLYDDFMSQRSTRDKLKSGNMLCVLNIVMQLRKCCNHPNLFEPRAVQSPLCLHRLEFLRPRMVMDLDDKVFGRDLPALLDIRKRFTGVCSSTVEQAPTLEDLEHSINIRPPIISGFRLHRPVSSVGIITTEANSLEIASVVHPNATEAQRSGFSQNENELVADGEDCEGIHEGGEGTPISMRMEVDDVRSVADSDELKPNDVTRICKMVTGVNGEKTVREVSSRLEQYSNGGNAPVPVSQVATPAPAEIAAMPGGEASTAVINLDTGCASKPVRVLYGQMPKKSNINVHPFLRCSTSVSKVVSLTVSTVASGFHYSMQNGGTHECNDMSESLVDLASRLSPPLKRRRDISPDVELVTGEFADLVPVEVLQRIEENIRSRLQRIVDHFECQQRPFYSTQFWIWVSPAIADAPIMVSSSAGYGCYSRSANAFLEDASGKLMSMVNPQIHTALVSAKLHFPELRLIEYDCGKLQALARLLRRLYTLKHRCLIFTQMSRMLDVLQAFLSYHGYQYFRLDGTTGVEQRQAMMERFNADTKIFCFILSTRSGGVGVNLTGADTVIFYDSDWNPTMDAQAQDRCHRIGQTRNVTIFRLISERTIEENILRKANQKRRLGEMAIDEAGFTPEFFKQSDNIRDLFDGDVEIGDVNTVDGPKSQKDVEKAMALLEDEQDVTAARLVMAENRADKAEFDESKSLAAAENSAKVIQSYLDSEEPLDEKYIELIGQLKPVERYAVNFLEAEYKPDFDEEVREAQALIEQKREEWVRAHNNALCNGEADPTVDGDSFSVDDDFYGAGILLDEVRSRRKNRVSASATEAVGTRAESSRHSVRLTLPQQNSKRTLSGRRVITPHFFPNLPVQSSHVLRPPPSDSLQRSGKQAELKTRSNLRKGAVKVSDTSAQSRHFRSSNPANTSPASPPNPDSSRKRSGRSRRVPDTDCSLPISLAAATNSDTREGSPNTEQVLPERPAATKNPPSLVGRNAATCPATSVYVRSPTIAGTALTSAVSSSSPPSSSSMSSLPFKSDISPQPRFPVRTFSRHSQLSALSSHSSCVSSRTSYHTSPVRLPVRVLQSSASTSRQSSHSVSINNSSVHPSSSLLVRRPGVDRGPLSMRVMAAQRPQQRYVVVRSTPNRMNVVLPTPNVRHTVMPVRRVIVQSRNAIAGVHSRVVQRPGLGEYERPRLQFRHKSTGNTSMEGEQ
uniref:Helicase ATP-binding domain-containing protein n=1 Tax=Angiostrongylus cantonensis TaxID=6313 RepID=A0A0K0DB73_ANGCA